MTLLDWDYSLETGDPDIDTQHRELVHLINCFHGMTAGARSPQLIAATLRKLVRYTQEHFGHEEHLMEAASYPDLASHRLEHRQLLNRTSELVEASQDGERMPVDILSRLLMDWLRGHILGSDRRLVDHLHPPRRTEGIDVGINASINAGINTSIEDGIDAGTDANINAGAKSRHPRAA